MRIKQQKHKEAATLAAQLAAAKAALAKINFRSAAQSIEYDRELIGLCE